MLGQLSYSGSEPCIIVAAITAVKSGDHASRAKPLL